MKSLNKIGDYELLSQKAYNILKTEIIKGSLKQGIKLSESKIAKQLGVSTTPVREALHKLATEGFVTLNPNRYIIIKKVSTKDLLEILQVRGALEGVAGSLAANKISAKEIVELEKINKRMSYFTRKDDMSIISETDVKFHDTILNISGNKLLTKLHDNLKSWIHEFRNKSLSMPGRLENSIKEHEEIFRAIKKGDSKQAEILSKEHIENVIKNIKVLKDKNVDYLNKGGKTEEQSKKAFPIP